MAYGTLSGTASKIFVFLDFDNDINTTPAHAFQVKWWGYASTSAGVLITDTMISGGQSTVYRDCGGVITFDPTSATAANLRTAVQTAARNWYSAPTATVVALFDTSGLLGL